MRLLCVALLLAACFKPTYDEGMICGEDRYCPDGQVCREDGRCHSSSPTYDCESDSDCAFGKSCKNDHRCVPTCPSGATCVASGGIMKSMAQGCFCIDVYEGNDSGMSAVPPLTNVTYAEADAICASRGARVCSEVEWVAACAGYKIEWNYPYSSDEYLAGLCSDEGELRNVDEPNSCATPDGVINLSGNVAELVGPCENGVCRVYGGSAQDGATELSCLSHYEIDRTESDDWIGFRCCAPQILGCDNGAQCNNLDDYYCREDMGGGVCTVIPVDLGDACDGDEDCGALTCHPSAHQCTVGCGVSGETDHCPYNWTCSAGLCQPE